MKGVRNAVIRVIVVYTIGLVMVVAVNQCGYTIPYMDEYVLGGGGIALVVSMLLLTTFKEGL